MIYQKRRKPSSCYNSQRLCQCYQLNPKFIVLEFLLYFADQKVSLIPSWLFLLGSFLFYGVSGACVGAVLFCRAARKEVYKYKGAFFFSLSLASGYLWYAAAFGSRFFVLATLMALAATFFLSVSAVCFYKVIPLTVIGMLFSLLWMIYLIILSLFFFFFL